MRRCSQTQRLPKRPHYNLLWRTGMSLCEIYCGHSISISMFPHNISHFLSSLLFCYLSFSDLLMLQPIISINQRAGQDRVGRGARVSNYYKTLAMMDCRLCCPTVSTHSPFRGSSVRKWRDEQNSTDCWKYGRDTIRIHWHNYLFSVHFIIFLRNKVK